MGAELFRSDRQTLAEMTMPFAAFRNFAKAPTNNLVEA
jgi:hypothetical protein